MKKLRTTLALQLGLRSDAEYNWGGPNFSGGEPKLHILMKGTKVLTLSVFQHQSVVGVLNMDGSARLQTLRRR